MNLPLELINKIIMFRPRKREFMNMRYEMVYETHYGWPNTDYSNHVGNTFARSYFLKFRTEHIRCDSCQGAYENEKVTVSYNNYIEERDNFEPGEISPISLCLKCDGVNRLQQNYFEMQHGFESEFEGWKRLTRKYERLKLKYEQACTALKRVRRHAELESDYESYDSD